MLGNSALASCYANPKTIAPEALKEVGMESISHEPIYPFICYDLKQNGTLRQHLRHKVK